MLKTSMEQGGLHVSVCAATLHTIKDLSVEGQHHRIIVYFLVSWLYYWIYKPCMEQHWRGQSMELRQSHTNQDNDRPQYNESDTNTKIKMNQCGLSGKWGYKTSVQGFTICCKTHDGTKNSLGLGNTISTEAACHYRYDFRLKHCVSTGGARLNAAGRRAGRTGLNLHFILVILFSTNKLKPEKT